MVYILKGACTSYKWQLAAIAYISTFWALEHGDQQYDQEIPYKSIRIIELPCIDVKSKPITGLSIYHVLSVAFSNLEFPCNKVHNVDSKEFLN